MPSWFGIVVDKLIVKWRVLEAGGRIDRADCEQRVKLKGKNFVIFKGKDIWKGVARAV